MPQSNEFVIERTTTIAAPAADVHPWIADLHHWRSWSPWEGMDPEMQRTHTGPESGVGAAYAWKGNRKAGQGRMEIIGSTVPTDVTIDLEFLKPFKARNVARFDLTESGGTTTVRWEMRGPKTLFSRIFGLVFDADKIVGKDFEKGLGTLKGLAESGAPPA